MNKLDLVNEVAAKLDMTKVDIEKVINTLVDVMTLGLQNGEKVILMGFGAFEVKSRKARVGKHPKTGEEISIPASKTINFKVGKALKEGL